MDAKLQQKDGWCGPAALSYVLSKYGKDISQEEIAKGITDKEGTEPWDMEAGARKYGLNPSVLSDDKDESFVFIEFLTDSGIPVIIDYLDGTKMSDGHYAVVDKVKGDRITIFNPSKGEETISKDFLFTHWKDKTAKGKIFKNWAMAVFK